MRNRDISPASRGATATTAHLGRAAPHESTRGVCCDSFENEKMLQGAHARGVLSVCTTLFDGRPLVCSSGYDKCIKLWEYDGEQLELLHTIKEVDNEGAWFSTVLTHTDDEGLLLCAGNYGRRVRVWNLDKLQEPPKLLWASDQHTGWVRALAASQNRHSATASSRLYSIGCNRILGWSLDQRNLETTNYRRRCCELELYEADDPESNDLYRSHDILTLAHDDDDEWLACGSVDGALRTFRTASLSSLETLSSRLPDHWLGHAGCRVASVVWGDGGTLLSAAYDGLVRSWRRKDSRTGGMTEAAAPCEQTNNVVATSAGSKAWSLEAEARVASVEGGRALALAVDSRREVALCGTNEGALVALRTADLSVISQDSLPAYSKEQNDALRATVIAALPTVSSERTQVPSGTDPAEQNAGAVCDHPIAFVVGDSDGGLHVHSVAQ